MMTATPRLTRTCAGLIGAGLPSGGTDMPYVSAAMKANCARHQSFCDGDEGMACTVARPHRAASHRPWSPLSLKFEAA